MNQVEPKLSKRKPTLETNPASVFDLIDQAESETLQTILTSSFPNPVFQDHRLKLLENKSSSRICSDIDFDQLVVQLESQAEAKLIAYTLSRQSFHFPNQIMNIVEQKTGLFSSSALVQDVFNNLCCQAFSSSSHQCLVVILNTSQFLVSLSKFAHSQTIWLHAVKYYLEQWEDLSESVDQQSYNSFNLKFLNFFLTCQLHLKTPLYLEQNFLLIASFLQTYELEFISCIEQFLRNQEARMKVSDRVVKLIIEQPQRQEIKANLEYEGTDKSNFIFIKKGKHSLIRLLEHHNIHVKLKGISLLKWVYIQLESGKSLAFSILLQFLNDQAGEVRSSVIDTLEGIVKLSSFGMKQLEALFFALRDKDNLARKKMLFTLGRVRVHSAKHLKYLVKEILGYLAQNREELKPVQKCILLIAETNYSLINPATLQELLLLQDYRSDNAFYLFILKILCLSKQKATSDFTKLENCVSKLALRKDLDVKFQKLKSMLSVPSDFVLFDQLYKLKELDQIQKGVCFSTLDSKEQVDQLFKSIYEKETGSVYQELKPLEELYYEQVSADLKNFMQNKLTLSQIITQIQHKCESIPSVPFTEQNQHVSGLLFVGDFFSLLNTVEQFKYMSMNNPKWDPNLIAQFVRNFIHFEVTHYFSEANTLFQKLISWLRTWFLVSVIKEKLKDAIHLGVSSVIPKSAWMFLLDCSNYSEDLSKELQMLEKLVNDYTEESKEIHSLLGCLSSIQNRIPLKSVLKIVDKLLKQELSRLKAQISTPSNGASLELLAKSENKVKFKGLISCALPDVALIARNKSQQILSTALITSKGNEWHAELPLKFQKIHGQTSIYVSVIARGVNIEKSVNFVKVCSELSGLYSLKRQAEIVVNLIRVSEQMRLAVQSF